MIVRLPEPKRGGEPPAQPELPGAALLDATLLDAALLDAALLDAARPNAALPNTASSDAALLSAALPNATLSNGLLSSATLPGAVLTIATNCNGGVKEVLCFDEVPDRAALWHWRCPKSKDFDGERTPILARAITDNYFDPCALLEMDARSELRDAFKERQPGGGWRLKT